MPTSEFVHKVTPDIVAEQIDKLRRLFPTVITEDEGGPRVDFGRLHATPGLASPAPLQNCSRCSVLHEGHSEDETLSTPQR